MCIFLGETLGFLKINVKNKVNYVTGVKMVLKRLQEGM